MNFPLYSVSNAIDLDMSQRNSGHLNVVSDAVKATKGKTALYLSKRQSVFHAAGTTIPQIGSVPSSRDKKN